MARVRTAMFLTSVLESFMSARTWRRNVVLGAVIHLDVVVFCELADKVVECHEAESASCDFIRSRRGAMPA